MKKRVATNKRRGVSKAVERASGPMNRSSPLRSDPARWTFLTNHAHVLICLHSHPDMVLREVAVHVGITERAVQRIVHELEESGFIAREKIGRRNQYKVDTSRPLRHPIESHRNIGDLLAMVAK